VTERVDTREAMAAALDRGPWEAVIADYLVPRFGGIDALRMMQARQIDIPFIVVSGAIGEETAVEAMRAGAHDYVLKHNRGRRGAAVRGELREAQVRLERRQAVAAMQQMARRSSFLADASRTLASSLAFEDTLEQAARVPVPEVADWCVVTVVE